MCNRKENHLQILFIKRKENPCIQELRKDKFLCSPSNITELPPTDLTIRVRASYLLFNIVSLQGSTMSSFIN